MCTESKLCLWCNQSFRGRTDKKFCNDYCRSAYNNKRLNGNDNSQIRYINNILRKNRKILGELLPISTNNIKTIRETLLTKGFQFEFFTHINESEKGKVFYCCYEYGYETIEDNKLLIVRQNKTTM